MTTMDGSLWPPRYEEWRAPDAAANDSSRAGVMIAVAVAAVTHLAIAALLTSLALSGADFHVPGAVMID